MAQHQQSHVKISQHTNGTWEILLKSSIKNVGMAPRYSSPMHIAAHSRFHAIARLSVECSSASFLCPILLQCSTTSPETAPAAAVTNAFSSSSSTNNKEAENMDVHMRAVAPATYGEQNGCDIANC
jgi:hypothetical protein